MAKTYNIDLDAGSDFAWEIQHQNQDGTPIDLTGGSAALVIRRGIPGSPAALTLSSASGGGLTITPEDGLITVAITRTQSAALSGRYVYDLHFTDAGDNRSRLVEGTVNVSPLL